LIVSLALKLNQLSADTGYAALISFDTWSDCAMTTGKQDGHRGEAWRKSWPVSLVFLLFLSATAGCSRHFFRERADKEVADVLTQKDKYEAWRIEQFHVYPDPRARFANPTNPDRQPMPPDDPAAYCLSPNPQKPGKAGIERVGGTGYLDLMAEWDATNRAEAAAKTDRQMAEVETDAEIELASWWTGEDADSQTAEKRYDQNEAGSNITGVTSLTAKPGTTQPYLLKLEQAVELGLINSREYQDAREDLYLLALPVTTERFSFAAQFFAAGQLLREWAGPQTPGGPKNDWALNSNGGVAKLFPTGALLLANFANQTVFNLAGVGGKPVVSQSTINLDLVQPLLRGAGTAVNLEPLTQSERDLVYEIRNYARFRKEFYVAIAGGGGGSITGASFQPTGVIARDPFAAGQGIGLTSGIVPGVINTEPITGNPALRVIPGASGRINLVTALAAPVSGYLSTLLQAAQMRVDQYNIDKLEEFLRLGKAMQEGGDISQLQVDQFEQQVLRGRTTLLSDQLQYLQSLDQFKLQLGLPTSLAIELDDAPFRPLNQQFQRYEDLFKEFTSASNEPLKFSSEEAVANVRKEMRRIFTSSDLVKGTTFRTQIESSWSGWEKLSATELDKRLISYRADRRRILDRQTDLETAGQTLSPADQQALAKLNFEIDLGEFESILRDYETRLWQNLADQTQRRRRQQLSYRYTVSAFILVLAEARTQRILQLRRTWPDLARLCVNNVDLLKADLTQSETTVVQTALANRLDLMNVRAQTVDAWRQLAVFANALLAPLNVQYHLTSTTPAGHAQPFAFNGNRTQQQLSLNTELPLVRIAERNSYRASLINYERARRILQRAKDGVAYDTRNEIRLLRQQEENYRIQERLVELGYLTVENSLDTFQQPPAPIPAGQVSPDLQTRAASLTNQLIQAQSQLYTAQFMMTTIWITYLNTRLQLYRDMELMPLDFRGVWIDDIASRECPSDSISGSTEGCSPGIGTDAPASERSERLPEPQPVAPAQKATVEQAK
jgi:hypothetical protein